MFPGISLLFIILSLGYFVSAQITTDPALPVGSKKVTVTFDSSKEGRLGYFTADLYAHTGLITESSANDTDWKYVIESWGNNTTQPKLTNKGGGIYEIEITPDIKQFYAVASGEKILKLAFVFRSSDGTKQTNNLYANVYAEGLAIQISEPAKNAIVLKNQNFAVSAVSSQEAQIKLIAGGNEIAQNTGTSISANHTFSKCGTFRIIATATANNETKRDSVEVFVRDEVNNQTKPAAFRKGINYPNDKSAALVLWAPKKEFVFVLGDFNDWKLSNDFQMKKDGDYFWLEIDRKSVV